MMTSVQPLVSVIVPIYNMQLYLRETIESVLKSSYSPYELILVDDGSTDNSAEIAKEYAERSNNIKLISQKNGGASKARNFGIENAAGKYILPVDADNLITEKYIEKAVELLESRPEVKVVSCEAIFLGKKQGKWELPTFSLKLLARKNLVDNCAMYRKSDWAIAGGYCNEILGREDWDFWISMFKSGGEFVRLPIVGLHYRVRSDSKRVRTRNLKMALNNQLNKRHKAFMYKYLGGKLQRSRTWSRLINFFYHLVKPEKIIVLNNDFEDFVYNIPELFGEGTVNTFQIKNTEIVVHKFNSKFSFKKSQAEKEMQNCLSGNCIGIYVKRSIFGYCESYFLKRK